jgi:hypothetical protein
MSRCSKPEFEDMLHAFELGLLKDEDRQRFEEHLLDCESCFERAKEFLPAAILLRHDKSLREGPSEATSTSGERTRWFRLTRLVAIAAVLIGVTLPTYWFGFRHEQPSEPAQPLRLLPLRGGSPPVLYLDKGGNAEISFAVDSSLASFGFQVTVLSRKQDTVFTDPYFTDLDSSNIGLIVLPITAFEPGFYQLIIEDPSGENAAPKRVYNFRVR